MHSATHGGVEEKREPAAMDQPHGIVEAGRGRRLECHAADLDRDRPDLGDLTEGRRRIGGVEKALQEFNPRDATGDLRRHEPELAMRISIVHVRLSLATGKAAVLPHGPWLNGHAAARKRAAASASHHLSTHGRSTTSNAQVDRCWRCSCR